MRDGCLAGRDRITGQTGTACDSAFGVERTFPALFDNDRHHASNQGTATKDEHRRHFGEKEFRHRCSGHCHCRHRHCRWFHFCFHLYYFWLTLHFFPFFTFFYFFNRTCCNWRFTFLVEVFFNVLCQFVVFLGIIFPQGRVSQLMADSTLVLVRKLIYLVTFSSLVFVINDRSKSNYCLIVIHT